MPSPLRATALPPGCRRLDVVLCVLNDAITSFSAGSYTPCGDWPSEECADRFISAVLQLERHAAFNAASRGFMLRRASDIETFARGVLRDVGSARLVYELLDTMCGHTVATLHVYAAVVAAQYGDRYRIYAVPTIASVAVPPRTTLVQFLGL